MKLPLSIPIAVFGLLPLNCKPAAPNTNSDTQTTGCPEVGKGYDLRKNKALPEFVNIALPVFKSIVQKYNADKVSTAPGGKNQNVGRVVTMLQNMKEGNIHPLLFFVTIADYETYMYRGAGKYGFPWTPSGKSPKGIPGTNCGQGILCKTVFQIRTNDGDWNSWCQSGGADIWKLEGGPDFCAGLWWWVDGGYPSSNGSNCSKLDKRDPCRTRGIPWTIGFVSSARKAYGQQKQCSTEWDAMYNSYFKASTQTSNQEVKRLASIAAFFKEIGLSSQ